MWLFEYYWNVIAFGFLAQFKFNLIYNKYLLEILLIVMLMTWLSAIFKLQGFNYFSTAGLVGWLKSFCFVMRFSLSGLSRNFSFKWNDWIRHKDVAQETSVGDLQRNWTSLCANDNLSLTKNDLNCASCGFPPSWLVFLLLDINCFFR